MRTYKPYFRSLKEGKPNFYLSNGGWDAFMEMIDNPPEPSAVRKALQEHQAPWDS